WTLISPDIEDTCCGAFESGGRSDLGFIGRTAGGTARESLDPFPNVVRHGLEVGMTAGRPSERRLRGACGPPQANAHLPRSKPALPSGHQGMSAVDPGRNDGSPAFDCQQANAGLEGLQ